MTRLSVVMSVYNGAATLTETLESLFAQSESDFELIVIDDGSTDATPQILGACTDPRLRVITQHNAGLTKALIRGCAEAKSDVIVRQDCGDRSHPERFRKQLALLDADASLVLVSCATRVVGPGGEPLYVVRANGEEIHAGLRNADADAVRGLAHHGTAMFRRDAYFAAGGYRPQFYFAQDLDLWIRLAALGGIAFVDDILYEARFEIGAISARYRDEQVALTRLMIAMRDEPSTDLLEAAAAIRPSSRPVTRREEARALYFVASCLRKERDPRWRAYAWKYVRRLFGLR